MRTVDGVSNLFTRLDRAIDTLIQNLFFGHKLSEEEREIVSLPVRMGGGGVGMIIPSEICEIQFKNSESITSPLSNAIIEQRELTKEDKAATKERKTEVKRNTERANQDKLKEIKDKLPNVRLRILELVSEQGASSWLNALPLRAYDFYLEKQAFWDALRLRYGIPLSKMPLNCICGASNNIEHAFNCKRGGFVTIRHNEIRDFTSELLNEVCHDVEVEPTLTPLTGEAFNYRTANTSDEEWSKSRMFTFTSQTTKALMTTLRVTAALAYDLLNEGYEYVLTSKFQSDPLERRYGNLRSMSGGRFLVSLTEVNNSQRILLLTSVIKEDINFWEHDLYEIKDLTLSWQHFKKDISIFASQMHESCLSADSLEVSATVSGYIAKKINEKVQCDACPPPPPPPPHLIYADNAENINNEYLLLISRGVPTNIMANFVAHAFSALSISEKTIQKYPFITARNAAKHVLNEYLDGYCLSCIDHADIVKRAAVQCIINIFYNNKQKAEGDTEKGQFEGF